MTHDIFISYAVKDKPIADAICANLEAAEMRCWIAPRDIVPGEDWPSAISKAISQSRVMVLVFSAHSNSSEDVGRELILAVNNRLVIIPFKIEDVEPEPGKQYYLARTHWLDAVNPPTREQIRLLVETARGLVVRDPVPAEAKAAEVVQAVPVSSVPAPAPAPVRKPKKRRAAWLYALIPVALAGLFGLWFGVVWLADLALANPSNERAAAAAAATATPLPAGKIFDILVSDTFLWNAYDWPLDQDIEDTDAILDLQIRSGEFHWKMDCQIEDGCYYFYYPAIRQVTDFDASVDVRHVSGGPRGYAGIVFRVLDSYNYHLFTVDDTSGYFMVWRVVANAGVAAVDWTESAAIRTSQVNHLEVSARGTTFTFSINGTQVAGIELTGAAFGTTGLQSGSFASGTMNTIFDNFEVKGRSTE